MSTFFAFLWLAANIAMVVFIIKAIKEKDHEEKKKKRKIWLICLAVAVISLFVFAVTDDSSNDEADTNTEISTNQTSTESEEVTDDSNVTDTTSDGSAEGETNAIELVAGELGEYGKNVIMNAGTDCEEELVVYYVPAGSYTVKNLGEHRTGVFVYEGFAKNEETGYDEYTNTGDILQLDVDGTGEIEVPEGWFIEIHEPTHISLIAK